MLREIGLLPLLYGQFLASNDKTLVSLPWRNYCHALSKPLFTNVTDFYSAFLHHSPSERNCTVCLSQHSRNQLCLPDLFKRDALDLLFNMLEHRQFYPCVEDDLLSLIRICGYLLINCDILHALLLNLLSLNKVCRSESGPAFVYEVYRNGFLESAVHYAQGIDHPNFYSLLKRNQTPSGQQHKRMYVYGSMIAALTVGHLDQSTHVHPSCSSGYSKGVIADWRQRGGQRRIPVSF